jgi:Protein of unknown function (DUF1236)
MTNRFMMSVAAAALIAGTGFASAQGVGREAPSAGSAAQPSEHAAPAARDAAEPAKPSSGVKATQSEQPTKPAPGAKATQSEQPPAAAKNQHAQDDIKAAPKGEKSAQDNDMKGEKSKSMSSENDNAKGAKDLKAEGREDRTGTKAEGRDGSMKAEGREDRKGNMNAETKGAEGRSQTTGQAAGGAKLSTEQRTKISTVIKEQNIRPVTNVNFAISVGTRVPREVSFHPLPVEIVSIYPDWRGYEMFLVNDQIIVVNPRTLEIVAVLDV